MALIFTFGIFPAESGKTLVSSAIARGLTNNNLKVGVFKPRSGHNIWYRQDTVLKGRSETRLFGEDIIKLKEAAKCPLEYEILNPIVALKSIPNLRSFFKRDQFDQLYQQLSSVYHSLYVERYSIWEKNELKSILLVNEPQIRKNLILVDPEYANKLITKADKVFYLENLDDWIAAFYKYSSPAIWSCYLKVKEYSNNIIIEGFNDVLVQEPRIISDVDIFLGVAPGSLIIFDSIEFKKTVRTFAELGRDVRSLVTQDIIKYLKGYEIFDIPPILSQYLLDYDYLSQKMEPIIHTILKSIQV